MQLKYLNFHVTNKCNLKCRHCLYSSGEKVIPELTFEDIKKIIDDFSLLTDNLGTVNLFGGEPLLRKDIFKIITYIRQKGLRTGITTNANFDENIIIKLSKSGIQRVTIDLDGGDSDTHDWLRTSTGHFKKSINNIRFLIKNNICTNITTVLHKNNYKEIYSILQNCVELKINSLALYLFTPLGRGSSFKELVLSGNEWLKLKEDIQKWVKIHKPNFDIIWERSYESLANSEEFFSLCDGEKKESIDVRCDGNVYYCGLLPSLENSPILGNLKKESLNIILEKRAQNALKNKQGCAALALNSDKICEKLIDPRKVINNIFPVCPYDWIFLNKVEKCN